jgi:hypothetical protein
MISFCLCMLPCLTAAAARDVKVTSAGDGQSPVRTLSQYFLSTAR